MRHLTVITGPMCSGKSDALIRLLSTFHQGDVAAARPVIDTRDNTSRITSRTGASIDAIKFTSPSGLLHRLVDLGRPPVVAIDEAQMMAEEDLSFLVGVLLGADTHVIVCGLLHDWQRIPFAGVLQCVGMADDNIMLKARCSICGEPANWSKRLTASTKRIDPGHEYEPRCSRCWEASL